MTSVARLAVDKDVTGGAHARVFVKRREGDAVFGEDLRIALHERRMRLGPVDGRGGRT